jgi:hypothetical protein
MPKYFLVCLPAYLFQPLKISKQDLVIRFSVKCSDVGTSTIEISGRINNDSSVSKSLFWVLII